MISAEKNNTLKMLPMRSNHRCFGCSPVNPAGLHMTFFTDEHSLCSFVNVPEHLSGWDRLVHGGVISTILDEIMGWSAIYLLKTLVLTKSIKVDFLKPVHIQTDLKAEGRVFEVTSEREAVMQGSLTNSAGELCARATGTFALFTPKAALKLGVVDEEALKDFKVFLDSACPT